MGKEMLWLSILLVASPELFQLTSGFHYTTTPRPDGHQRTTTLVPVTVTEMTDRHGHTTDLYIGEDEMVNGLGNGNGAGAETETETEMTTSHNWDEEKKRDAIVRASGRDFHLDRDVEIETRSFYSSRRKNKVGEAHQPNLDPHHKSKDKYSDMEGKLRITDLSDDLDTWEAPESLKKNYPYYLAGYDHEERPLWVAEYGRFNVRQLIEQGKESTAELEKYAKQAAFRIIRSIRMRKREVGDVSEATVIIDLEGLSFSQLSHPPTLVFVMRMTRIYADLVDKYVGHVLIINANYVAETLINLLRPSFGAVMEKVDIYGTQASKWKPVLRQLFPLESIPSWYGGGQGFKPIKVYG